MTLSFDGKVAVATGVGGGLGRSHALELARRGAHVVGNDLGGDNAAAQQVVDEITAAGGEAVPSYDSVATPEGGKAIIQAARDTLGKVDIVIDDAGIFVGVTPGIVEHDLTVETMAERLAEIRNECVPSSAIHLLDVAHDLPVGPHLGVDEAVGCGIHRRGIALGAGGADASDETMSGASRS